MITPYAGWFSPIAKTGEIPAVWKQTMIVLLILFPIVMLELKYLSPWTSNLNPSLSTFIGNAISVSLIAWPMMPIAILFLGWWLSPKGFDIRRATIIGTCLLILLYLVEIAIFWNLLS
jgi:antibiotic biosynthesis monooxygenase (ABM) superfamily enzyme